MIDFCYYISNIEGAFLSVDIDQSKNISIYLYNIILLLLFGKIKSIISRLIFLPFLCFLLLILLL